MPRRLEHCVCARLDRVLRLLEESKAFLNGSSGRRVSAKIRRRIVVSLHIANIRDARLRLAGRRRPRLCLLVALFDRRYRRASDTNAKIGAPPHAQLPEATAGAGRRAGPQAPLVRCVPLSVGAPGPICLPLIQVCLAEFGLKVGAAERVVRPLTGLRVGDMVIMLIADHIGEEQVHTFVLVGAACLADDDRCSAIMLAAAVVRQRLPANRERLRRLVQ